MTDLGDLPPGDEIPQAALPLLPHAPHRVAGDRGAGWIVEGWDCFKAATVPWLLLSSCLKAGSSQQRRHLGAAEWCLWYQRQGSGIALNEAFGHLAALVVGSEKLPAALHYPCA